MTTTKRSQPQQLHALSVLTSMARSSALVRRRLVKAHLAEALVARLSAEAAVRVLELLNLLCAPGEPGRGPNDGGGCLPSEAETVAVSCREAVALAGGVGACKRLLEASMRGGRSREERRLRCEALAALGALGAAREGPRLLRQTGVVRLLSSVISSAGPSSSPRAAASGRGWTRARAARTRSRRGA